MIPSVGSAVVGDDISFKMVPTVTTTTDGVYLASSLFTHVDVYTKSADSATPTVTTYWNGTSKEIVDNVLTLKQVEGGYVIKAYFQDGMGGIGLIGGNGTEEHPYLIDAKQASLASRALEATNSNNDYAYFKVAEPNQTISKWTTATYLFGSLDFNGATIENMKNYLFGYIGNQYSDKPTVLSNVTIKNPQINPSSVFGGAVAFTLHGDVDFNNVHVDGGSIITNSGYGAGSFLAMIGSDVKDDVNTINFINSTSSADIYGSSGTIAGFVGPVRTDFQSKPNARIVINVKEGSEYTGTERIYNDSNYNDLASTAYVMPRDWANILSQKLSDGSSRFEANVADASTNKLLKAFDNSYYKTEYSYNKFIPFTDHGTTYNTADGSENGTYKTDVSSVKVKADEGATQAKFTLSIGFTDKNYIQAWNQSDLITSTTAEDGVNYFVSSAIKNYKIGCNGLFWDQTGTKITTGTPKWTLAAGSGTWKQEGDFLMFATGSNLSWGADFTKNNPGFKSATITVTQYDADNNPLSTQAISFAHSTY